ncbi:MAG: ATP-binding cassette domain-containing protein [Clostridia bacterium]|nr:ATP-binding cassette domain-containing protein [Clostridia bacterium]
MELKNISKSYDGKKVLDAFSLKAEKGKPVCIFGPSGCGKTTLLNITAGLTKADSGEVTGNEGRISYLFQEDRLLEWCTARENIMLTAKNKTAAEEFVKAAGIADALDLYPGQMSGGMRRRTAMARAVAYDGDIVLLDEPFNGIDDKTAEKTAGFLRRFVKDKVCILVTHRKKEAELLDAGIIVID